MTIHNQARRRFLVQTAGGVVVLVGGVGGRAGSEVAGVGGRAGSEVGAGQGAQAATPIPARPPALPADLVRNFVQKAHADLAATTSLLAEQPALLNATWDWGGGDFEAAIGGAGHMGNRAIAEFLIGQGARFDLFVAAMLGRLDIVRTIISAWPHLVSAKGPHGISLLRHARAGGEPAGAVVEYLLSKGAE